MRLSCPKSSTQFPESQQFNLKMGSLPHLPVQGMSYRDGREIRIDGTKGTVTGRFYNTGYFVDVYEHLTGSSLHYVCQLMPSGCRWRLSHCGWFH